jgi:PTH1 family peptidyl-tRNA hydrolase
MIIVIGLGNPGEKFKNTRHNVGFMAIDFFAQKNNFPEFELSKKYNSLVAKNSPSIKGSGGAKEDILLAKPQTFMNESGIAVKSILKNSKETTLIVIHDDIDLPIGKLKVVKERGSAGHKGVESIIQNVGNENVIRFRIGIAKNETKSEKAKQTVLKNFTKEEQETIHFVIAKTSDALDFFIQHGLEKTMNEYNR